tara:strand:- start:143 stop:556 length:414 start_codon:yes stop_codon:yes gene_type:complete
MGEDSKIRSTRCCIIFKTKTVAKIHILKNIGVGLLKHFSNLFFYNKIKSLKMPLNLKSDSIFFTTLFKSKNNYYVLFIWVFLGLFLLYINPYYFLSYIFYLFGFSLFIYSIGAYKKPFLSIKTSPCYTEYSTSPPQI